MACVSAYATRSANYWHQFPAAARRMRKRAALQRTLNKENYCFISFTLSNDLNVPLCRTGNDTFEKDIVFLHQSQWQQEMMAVYGNDICVIDGTYNTNMYGLPLLFVCVSTNVCYATVATMLLCDETKQSILAGLQQLAEWNPGWKPRYFMSDYHEGQIAGLQLAFPGKCMNVFKILNEIICKFNDGMFRNSFTTIFAQSLASKFLHS